MTGPETKPRQSVLIASHAWYDDLIGGAFRLASEFAEDLASRGHDVAFVSAATDDAQPRRENVRGVDLYRYQPPAATLSRFKKLKAHIAKTSSCVRDVLNDRHVDVINGHSPLQFRGCLDTVRTHGIRSVYTVHSPFDAEMTSNLGEPHGLVRRLKRFATGWVGRTVERKNIAAASVVHTLSDYTRTTLREKHDVALGAKVAVAPGWVDYERFRPTADRDALRSQLGGRWQTDLPVFFTLRRLEERMGLDTLVDAAAVLKRGGYDFRVLIGGGGSLRQELERRVAGAGLDETVSFLGRLEEGDLPACYGAASCFVLPTRALECFGLIVLESFAANTPVIASDVAAIPELAASQGDDWLFAPGDVSGLALRMRQFLDGVLRQRDELREFAARFNRPRVVDRWEQMLFGTDEQDATGSVRSFAEAST